MATYTYTGKLTDFSEAPFPGAAPVLWVTPDGSAFGPDGLLSENIIPVAIATDGTFLVPLVASSDTSPPTLYTLRCKWLAPDGLGGTYIVGLSEWKFTAVVGGGAVKDMVTAPVSVWFVGPPWPAPEPSGFYFDRYTNDVGRKN